jgi:ElaB/YqjD/DUF883 family membrane-anchored ribosome-binding protein
MPHTEAQVSRRPADYAQTAEDQFDAIRKGANELASQVGEQARVAADQATATVKEHPVITIAVAAGLAFALGALWKMRAPSRQSQIEALMSRLPDRLPTASQIKSYWR